MKTRLLAVLWAAFLLPATAQNSNFGTASNIQPARVAQLPAAASAPNGIRHVTDGNSATDCTVGGGSTKVTCISNGSTWAAAGGGGGGTWGSITGTLSDQTDLQTALNLKADLASPTFTGTVVLPNSQTLTTPTIASFTNAAHNHTNAAGGAQLTDAALSAAVTVPKGGTGIASGTSGGIPYFSASTTIASSAALTANLPVIGGGAGVAPAVGTRSGNTTAYVTTTGSQTSGNCVSIDANGNHIANGSACPAALSGLTTSAFVAGASATTVATPSATSTLDSSGNAAFVGTVGIGSSPPACTAGSSGAWCQTEGTAFTNVASTAGIYADSTAHEFVAKTNGASTGGILVRAQPSAVNLTAQTATKTITTLCAASAGACNIAGQYHIHFNFWQSGTACSNVTAGSVTFALTWVDENATTHSAVIIPMLSQTSATAVAMGNSYLFQTALANQSASGDYTVSTNGSVIQYTATYTACTTGTGTYNLRATATRLQ